MVGGSGFYAAAAQVIPLLVLGLILERVLAPARAVPFLVQQALCGAFVLGEVAALVALFREDGGNWYTAVLVIAALALIVLGFILLVVVLPLIGDPPADPRLAAALQSGYAAAVGTLVLTAFASLVRVLFREDAADADLVGSAVGVALMVLLGLAGFLAWRALRGRGPA